MIRGTVNDWATRAAEYLVDTPQRRDATRAQRVSRIAAVIATFAEPHLKQLHSMRKTHTSRCPAAKDEDDTCKCGARAWNARIDKSLE